MSLRILSKWRGQAKRSMTTVDDIRERLTEIRPVGFPRDVVAAGMVRGINNQDGAVAIVLEPPAMAPPILSAMVADIRRAVGALDGVKAVDVQLSQAPPSGGVQPGQSGASEELGPLPGIADIIAVASTK